MSRRYDRVEMTRVEVSRVEIPRAPKCLALKCNSSKCFASKCLASKCLTSKWPREISRASKRLASKCHLSKCRAEMTRHPVNDSVTVGILSRAFVAHVYRTVNVFPRFYSIVRVFFFSIIISRYRYNYNVSFSFFFNRTFFFFSLYCLFILLAVRFKRNLKYYNFFFLPSIHDDNINRSFNRVRTRQNFSTQVPTSCEKKKRL